MGTKPLGSIVAIVATATLVAACTSPRFGSLNTQPAPLSPAPSGTVTSGQLPPPSGPQTAQGNFPTAPGGTQPGLVAPVDPNDPNAIGTTDGTGVGVDGGTQVASTTPVSRDTMVGAWRVSTQGASCQMFMALTQSAAGLRAASRGCPGEVAAISSWDVSGNQVVLNDSSGNRVASLFQSGEGRFDGQTTSGQALSLAR